MRRVVAATTVIAAVLAFAASALATHLPTTGVPIRLLNPAATPATFPAKTPFFVRHGWVCPPGERAICLDPSTEFRLYVDGTRMPSALDLELNLACPLVLPPSNECTGKGT